MLFSADSKCSDDARKWKTNLLRLSHLACALPEYSDLSLYSSFEKEDGTFLAYAWRKFFKTR